jgi:dienelactone hydrolase
MPLAWILCKTACEPLGLMHWVHPDELLSRLADSMAKAGYLVVLPDYFEGEPAPQVTLGFDFAAWIGRHNPSRVETVIDNALKYMRDTLGTKNIGIVGYCFGGRYVARYLAAGKGIQAGFTAHPSLVEPAEWEAIKQPLSIAAAGEF